MSQGEIQTHPTEMSQGENGSDEEALHQRLITSTIVQKIRVGAKKTESFSSACIYRVPEQLRMLKEIAYTPHLIAIGPLHREDNHLKTPFQHIKMSYTNHLLSRLTVGIVDLESAEKMELTVVQECLAELKTLIDDAKKCYAEEVTLNEEMMLVDGCFILEFLYGYRAFMGSNDNPADFDVEDADTDDDNDVDDTKDADEAAHGEQAIDPIFGNNLNCAKVINDLVLMENQIPLFVLEKLFPLTVGRIPDCPDKDWLLTDYLQWFYDIVMEPLRNSNNSGSSKSSWCSPGDCVLRVFDCTTTAAEEEEEVESGNINDHRTTAKYYHILHYLHDRYLPNFQTEPEDYDFREMPSASELAYAGIKFVPDTEKDLFKFKFREPGLFQCCHRARFIIPLVTLEDSTEALLRNLIALEQCCPGVKEHVSSYAVVMDMLVNTDKDIQVLVKAGVLRNWLGATRDATDLFNNLCKEIILGEYFFDTCFKASKYSKRFWPKNMAHVRRTYFKSPWTFIAFCVGFIVFIVTVLQFVHDFFNISG